MSDAVSYLSPVPRDQLWFHHPEMQQRIREAEADVAAGRVEKTRTAKAAQALLDARKAKPKRPRR